MKWHFRLLVASSLLVAIGCSHGAGHTHSLRSQDETSAAALSTGVERLAREVGIELVSLRTVAGGHMLDLRYRVVDPELASKLEKKGSPLRMEVVDPASGMVAEVPQTMLGKLRTKVPKSQVGRIHFILFSNPHQVIKSGQMVEVRFGDVQVKNWQVL